MTEPAGTSCRRRELLFSHRLKHDVLDPLNDQLGNAIPAVHLVVLMRICVDEEDPHLTPVTGIDQAWRVQACDAMSEGESATRQDESGVSFGHCDDQTGWDERPPATRGEHRIRASTEVGAGIPRSRVRGQRRVRLESVDRHGQHRENLVGAACRRPGRTLGAPGGHR